MLTATTAHPGALGRALDHITPWWRINEARDEAMCADYNGKQLELCGREIEIEWLGFNVTLSLSYVEPGPIRFIVNALRPPAPGTRAAQFITHCATALWILGLAEIAFLWWLA
jgi:hypothetical protein